MPRSQLSLPLEIFGEGEGISENAKPNCIKTRTNNNQKRGLVAGRILGHLKSVQNLNRIPVFDSEFATPTVGLSLRKLALHSQMTHAVHQLLRTSTARLFASLSQFLSVCNEQSPFPCQALPPPVQQQRCSSPSRLLFWHYEIVSH